MAVMTVTNSVICKPLTSQPIYLGASICALSAFRSSMTGSRQRLRRQDQRLFGLQPGTAIGSIEVAPARQIQQAVTVQMQMLDSAFAGDGNTVNLVVRETGALAGTDTEAVADLQAGLRCCAGLPYGIRFF